MSHFLFQDHFRRINGTSPGNFEGHLCEIMWRSWVKGNQVSGLFSLIKAQYPLTTEPTLYKRLRVFSGWADPDLDDSPDAHFTVHRCPDGERGDIAEDETFVEGN